MVPSREDVGMMKEGWLAAIPGRLPLLRLLGVTHYPLLEVEIAIEIVGDGFHCGENVAGEKGIAAVLPAIGCAEY